MSRQSFLTYVIAAAKSRGNLAMLAGGVVAAVLLEEERDLVQLFLVGAEVAYLGLVPMLPAYRALIDGKASQRSNSRLQLTAQGRFEDLLSSLVPARAARFETVRTRCNALKEAVASRDEMLSAIAKEQLAFVDRLLWVFLKLLETDQNLERFLGGVSERELGKEIIRAKEQLDLLMVAGRDAVEDRKRTVLDDTVQTLSQRRANIGRARHNHELVGFEIQRIEQKLTIIAELAINRQDPAVLTAEVDSMADSVRATEETIGELQAFVGGNEPDVAVPRILVDEKRAVRRG